jgi:hypothetical protein
MLSLFSEKNTFLCIPLFIFLSAVCSSQLIAEIFTISVYSVNCQHIFCSPSVPPTHANKIYAYQWLLMMHIFCSPSLPPTHTNKIYIPVTVDDSTYFAQCFEIFYHMCTILLLKKVNNCQNNASQNLYTLYL